MPEYIIQTEEMNRIMNLLYHVLKIRITFFTVDGRELNFASIKAPCAFCRKKRRNPEFDALCIACDRQHLQEAQEYREALVYQCHAGLLEGIVPLYDKSRNYLGAVVFGQLADRKCPYPGIKQSSKEEMLEIAKLLQYLGEYICENELIRQCSASWGERAKTYIQAHLTEPVSLTRAAKYCGCSVSNFSHKFPKIMGKPLKAYIREERVQLAKKMLHEGLPVKECAMKLGYSDSFCFSKDFKLSAGLSPLHWRKKTFPQNEE